MPSIIPTITIQRVARIVADDATVTLGGWYRKIHIVQEGGAAICVEMSGASPHALSIASADVVELTEVSGARAMRWADEAQSERQTGPGVMTLDAEDFAQFERVMKGGDAPSPANPIGHEQQPDTPTTAPATSDAAPAGDTTAGGGDAAIAEIGRQVKVGATGQSGRAAE